MGQERYNHLGDNASEIGDGLPYLNLGTISTAKKISGGYLHYCAILSNDDLKCWGYNAHGQLGLGDNVHRGRNVGDMGDNLQVNPIGKVKDVAAGAFHTCVITLDDEVKCWGYNTYGELGQGNTTRIGNTEAAEITSGFPAPINLDDTRGLIPKKVIAGAYITCVIFTNDKVKCLGLNSRISSLLGHLGNEVSDMGDNLPFLDFGSFDGAEEKVQRVSTGPNGSHICFLLTSNRVKCLGNNSFGQVGQGDTQVWGDIASEKNDGLHYVDLGTGRTAVDVAAGNTHSCAILDNDLLKLSLIHI